MHLLPHKSWNVWSAKNKEKVLRDEREHELKLQEQKRRQIEIESERRYERLRKRKKGNNEVDSHTESNEDNKNIENFCLFDEEEIERHLKQLNEIKEKEEMAMKESTPWYMKGEEEISEFEKEKIENKKSEKDPLRDVDRYLKMKKDKGKDKMKKKKKQKRSRSDENEKSVIRQDSNEDKLQKLREERLKRESEERRRAEELLMRYRNQK